MTELQSSTGAIGAHSPSQASGFYNWTLPCQTEGQTWQLMKLLWVNQVNGPFLSHTQKLHSECIL